jgi:hypothetical protein
MGMSWSNRLFDIKIKLNNQGKPEFDSLQDWRKKPCINFILKNSTIELDKALRENMVKSLDSGLYEDFLTGIMFDARNIVNTRYSEGKQPGWLDDVYGQDAISLTLFEDLSKRSSIWKRIKNSKESGRDLISLILSGNEKNRKKDKKPGKRN